MPNPRPQTPRSSQRSDPPTPKPKSKAKSSRSRVLSKKSSANARPSSASKGIGTPTGSGPTTLTTQLAPKTLAPSSVPPTPTSTIPLPTLPLPSTSAAPLTPTTTPTTPAASTTTSRPAGSKRARPSSHSREPDLKRVKSAASPRPPLTPSPASPTTSSRSRPRSRKRSGPNNSASAITTSLTLDADPSNASHVLSAATSVATRSRPNTKRTPRAVSGPPPANAALLSLDGVPVLPIVKQTWTSRRFFGREIQCLMHAFGEVRCCTRDVLELMEDAVREAVIRVCHRLAARDTEVTVEAVAGLLCSDFGASSRMQTSFRNCADSADSGSNIDAMPFSKRPWEAISDLANLRSSPDYDRTHPTADPYQICFYAFRAFRVAMGQTSFAEFYRCRGVVFLRPDNRVHAGGGVTSLNTANSGGNNDKAAGRTQLAKFREWLGPTLKDVRLSEGALFALGHIAWEAVGLITQTALQQRYMNDLDRGIGDPRAREWTNGRHVIEMLAHGLGTAILIPLTELQQLNLRSEMETFYNRSVALPKSWRPHIHASSPYLLPEHINDAVQKLCASHTQKSLGHRPGGFMSID